MKTTAALTTLVRWVTQSHQHVWQAWWVSCHYTLNKSMTIHNKIRPRVPSGLVFPDHGNGRNRNQTRGAKNPWVTSGCQSAKELYIATFNIRTMRTEEKMQELEEELLNIKWDFLGLSETRLPTEKCSVLKSGHMLYQNNSEVNSHVGGVGILINKRWKHKNEKMQCISDRVIYITVTLSRRYSLKLIQVYAPTTTHEDEEVERFYEDISKAQQEDKTHFTMIVGDFNAKVGQKWDENESCLGTFGLGARNERGETLVNYLHSENLYCMNTFFQKPTQRKWTWVSPNGKVKNEIDFIISNNTTIITDVSVLNKFNVGSDHRLVRAKVVINTKSERNKLILHRPHPTAFELENHATKYQEILTSKLSSTEELKTIDLDTLAEKITNDIQIANRTIITRNKPQCKKMLGNEVNKLIQQRQLLDRQSVECRQLNRKISREIRKEKRAYNTELIKQTIQDNMNMRVLRSKLSKDKTKIYKIKDEHGTIVRSKIEIVKTIQNFYENLYKSQSQLDKPYNKKPIMNVNSEEIPDIEVSEIIHALHKMKNGRSPGEDSITNEMLKVGGTALMRAIQILLNKCLQLGKIPKSWQNAQVILLHKKGDNTNIENYRPISLLSHLYKLLTKIIVNRLSAKLDFYQPQEQAGFRKGFSTVDHLQTIRTLIEKATEYNVPIHLAFVDYHKAFDSIELWAILKAMDQARIDSRYSDLIKYIYTNATLQIKIDEDMITDKINIQRGVRQGDTISPKLFTLALEDVFKTLKWDNLGINIEGKMLHHLRFADDIVLIGSSIKEIEDMLAELNTASRKMGLQMNLTKTKIMSHSPADIRIGGKQIENVSEYIYLGHNIKLGKENQIKEITRRIRLGWTAFGKLGHILKNKNIPINLKREVFNKCVIPVLTYGLETTTLTVKTANKIRVAQRSMERAMLGLTLADRIRNDEIRKTTGVSDVIQRISELKWRWAGHVARYEEDRWPKRIIQWRPRSAKRNIGRPQKRWEDDIKKVAGRKWHQKATDRDHWKCLEEAYIQQWMLEG